MHQYCFYLDWAGMTSSDWAAWVQAIGTLIAIGVAVWLPRRDRLRQEREAQAAARTRERTVALGVLRRLRLFLQTTEEHVQYFRGGGMRWVDVAEPMSQMVEDPPADPLALGGAAQIYQTFLARCDEAVTSITSIMNRERGEPIREGAEAEAALNKVETSRAAAQALKAALERIVGVEPTAADAAARAA